LFGGFRNGEKDKRKGENMRKILLLMTIVAVICILAGCKSDRTPPEIVETFPARGAKDVDPNITEIWVKFNEPMMDNSWSWCNEAMGRFPETYGKPYYTDNCTRNVLPVQLNPNTAYVIWINMNQYNNFRDQSGNPLKPCRLAFETGDSLRDESE
jgi:hypothetical protein